MALSFFGPTLEMGTEQQARNGCRIHRAGSHGYVSCIQISKYPSSKYCNSYAGL